MLGLINNLLSQNVVSEGYIDNYSVAFDGTGDFIDLENTFQSVFRDSFSISFWCKLTDGQPSSTQAFFGSTNASGEDNVYLNFAATGKISFVYEADNDLAAYSTGAVVFGNGDTGWKHVVITQTHSGSGNATPALFVDGDAVTISPSGPGGGLVVTEANAQAFTTDQNLYIGGRNSNGSLVEPMIGNLNDFAIWDEALDGDAVTAIYNSGSPTDLTIDSGNYDNSGDLVGYWKFELTASDSAGSNDGTFSGDPQYDNDTP